MKQDKGDTIRIVVIVSMLILLIIVLFKTEFDYKHEVDNYDKATQQEKKSEGNIQHGKVKAVKLNQKKNKITLENGLTFEDKSDLSRHIEPHDKISYVKYRDYKSSKSSVTKGEVKYKVKNIEKS